MNIVERNQLKALVGDDLWSVLKEYKAIIAGGAITSLFCNREVNDLDIYFRSEEMLVRTVAAIYGEDDYTDMGCVLASFNVLISSISQRTLVGRVDGKQDIQLMTFKYFDSPEKIFESFDFTCVMGAFDFATEEFVFHDEFFKHNSQRYLKFNKGTDFPMMSMLRVGKYQERGYTISKAEYMRMLARCMSLPLTSWDEAKNHIGGMYGYDMSKAFDEGKDFSLEELCDQLGTIQERGAEMYVTTPHTTVSWEQICSLFYKPEEKKEEDNFPNFNDSGYPIYRDSPCVKQLKEKYSLSKDTNKKEEFIKF